MKKLGKFLLVLLCVVCLGLDMWGIYYLTNLKDNVTITTGYVDSMEFTEDEKFFIEVQSFPNMFEMKLNYYTDTTIPEYDEETKSYGEKYTYSSGIQFDGGYQAQYDYKYTGFMGLGTSYVNYDLKNEHYYHSDNYGNTFSTIQSVSHENKWIYDIDGKLVLLETKGYVQYAKNPYGYPKMLNMNIPVMLYDLACSVQSVEDGKHVVTFNLSDYFTFSLYNEESGKFEKTTNNTTESWMYVNVLVNKHSTTFVSAEQSMFGMFMGDNEWSLYDLESVDFWRARHEYNLGIEHFTIVYEDNKYYLKLQQNVVNYLKNFNNMQYFVEIDLDNIYLGSEKIEVEGFIENCFDCIAIDKITLTSEETRQFVVYETYNLEYSENITLVQEGVA